jgi:Mce-associated membrane protein
MNAVSEPPIDPDDSVPRVDPDDSGRSGTSSAGLAAATLRALRAGNRDEPSADVGDEPADDVVDDEVDESSADVVDAPTDEVVEVDPTDEIVEVEPEPVSLRKAPVVEEPSVVASTGSRSSLITVACAVLAAAALVFAIVAGVSWWHAGHNGQRRIGIAREQIDADARLAITTVNTSDYRHPSAALDNWLDASTGSLHSQFSQSRTTAVKLLAQAKMITKADVLDAAVTELNLTKGTATVIASVNVTRTPVSGSVSTVRNRFKASMTRDGNSWKLSNLAVVPVSLS